MSAGNHDAEQESAQAVGWTANWRKLELEALQFARAMGDPEARRHMFFISEAYRLLAERAESRRDRLVRRGGIGRQSQSCFDRSGHA